MSISAVINQAKRQVAVSGQQLALGNVSRAVSGLVDIPGTALRNLRNTGGVELGDAFAGINARGDAVQNWCWYALLPDITNRNALSFGGLQPSVSLPWYYVQSANLPWRKIATDSVQMNGHARHYPQSYSVDQLTLGLFMDTKGVAQQYLHAYQSLILSNGDPANPENQGLWGVPADYKKDIHVVVLDTAHRQMLNVKYTGCWPSDPDQLDLSGASSEALIQNVTFMVEDVFVTVSNAEGILENLKETAIGYGVSALRGALGDRLNNLGEDLLSIF